jgi:hypothetical protein
MFPRSKHEAARRFVGSRPIGGARMHEKTLHHLISCLENARLRPQMYFTVVDPMAVTNFLNGVEIAVSNWFGMMRIHRIRRMIEEEKGWADDCTLLASRLLKRGLSQLETIDELLATEIELLRQLLDLEPDN